MLLPQYNHDLLTSLMLWVDHKVSNDQQSFTNYGTMLFPQVDASVPQYNVWASPYKSWIYDSSVSGANVISGAWTTSGQFLTRDSGITIDFTNARILSTNNWGPLSGDYSVRDFNFYLSSEQEMNFFFEKVYDNNLNIGYNPTGAQPYVFYAPMIIFTNAMDTNDAFALGGLDETKNIVRAYIISNNNYLQEGINSYFRDLARRYIPLASFADAPLNYLNDLKSQFSGIWNYSENIFDVYGCSGELYITFIHNYKMSEKTNKNTKYMISVTDFETSKLRFPRVV